MIDMDRLLTLQGTLFLLMALGIFFRRKIVDERFEAGLTELILDLILPCNIVTSFLAEFNGDVLSTTAVTLLVSTGVQLFCWVLTQCLYRRFSPGERAVAQYATMCSNGSFLGIPMVEGLWGSQGVVLGNFFVVPQRIMTWTCASGSLRRTGSRACSASFSPRRA